MNGAGQDLSSKLEIVVLSCASQSNQELWFSGPVCTGHSRMGKQLRESDPCFKTHQSYYEQVKPLVDVMLIENVPEYKPCVIQKELGPEWQMESAVVDPRVFGVAASRSRLYAICWKTETVTWRADVKMKEVIDLLTSSVVAEAGTFYWKDLPKSKLTESQVFRPNLEIKDIRIS